MSLSLADVKKVATLARLELSAGDLAEMADQLNRILGLGDPDLTAGNQDLVITLNSNEGKVTGSLAIQGGATSPIEFVRRSYRHPRSPLRLSAGTRPRGTHPRCSSCGP